MDSAQAPLRQEPVADGLRIADCGLANERHEFDPQSADRNPRSELADIEAQRSALRVQVAAVAAQQASLFDQEIRLQQQQGALTQQQHQLAAHLEEKRHQLLELADQVQTARAALKSERQQLARTAALEAEQQIKKQLELDEAQQNLGQERQRLRLLRRRLKQHFHRRWAAADQQIRDRETAVNDQHGRIEKEAARLHEERCTLIKERLDFNGEAELGKRQLQAERQRLALEQRQWLEEHQRQHAQLVAGLQTLGQREQALGDAERIFGDAQHAWEQKRKLAEQEATGLESRVVNLRRKLHELQRDLSQHSETRRLGVGEPPRVSERVESQADQENQQFNDKSDGSAQPVSLSPSLPVSLPRSYQPTEHQALATQLQRLAEDLYDQRLELVEHWQRLTVAQEQWQQAQIVAVDGLEALTRGLPEKEQALLARQEALAVAQTSLGKRQEELSQARLHLEAWVSRLHVREATWESQRDQWLADLHSREQTAEKHLAALVELRQSWASRRRQEIDQLLAERAACDSLRQEYAQLRQDCWKRSLALDEQQREHSEKTQALEEYRQRIVLKSPDAAAVENRLERIRKRWALHNAALMTTAKEQFALLQAEAARMHQRGRELLKAAEEISHREADLAERQKAWEETCTFSEARQTVLDQQLESARAQRARLERQVAELQTEVERLARVLLDEVPEPGPILTLAA